MILDVAFFAVFTALLIALWANYRLDVRIARLRAELDRAAAWGLERDLLR